MLAAGAAIGVATFWPNALIDHETIAGGLALMPALLLSHHRGWQNVSLLLSAGLLLLVAMHLLGIESLPSLRGPVFIVFVLGPYIAIALGAGWFGEVRRYRAELRATQLQLIQAEKLESIGRMAAGVAHEVKNPLMTILVGVKVLSRRIDTTDERTHQLLQDMADAVARADRIISGLLSYSRNEELQVTNGDLNATISASLELMKHQFEQSRITVVAELDSSLPSVAFDHFKVQQVLLNLFTNAVHAMGAEGTLSIRTAIETMVRGEHVGHRLTDRFEPGERVATLVIDDSGPGIAEEHLRKVFDPFFTTKPTGIGTGLGLAVSKQIIEMHGGAVHIANRPEGGVRVRVLFKLSDNRSNS